MNKGILTRNEDGVWMVKWSDLHSFLYGTHWMYTELSNDSNSLKYIKDGEVKYEALKEGVEVVFEIVTSGYDNETFAPNNSARLIFPEVEEPIKEKNVEQLNQKYLGLVLDERNDNYTIGYKETTEIEKLREWKKEMLECSNVVDCKIIKIEDYE